MEKKDESKFEDLIKLNKVDKRSLIGECNPTDLIRLALSCHVTQNPSTDRLSRAINWSAMRTMF